MEDCTESFKLFIHFLHEKKIYHLFVKNYKNYKSDGDSAKTSWETTRRNLFETKTYYKAKVEISTFLNYGFLWKDTPEGRDFWDNIYWNVAD